MLRFGIGSFGINSRTPDYLDSAAELCMLSLGVEAISKLLSWALRICKHLDWKRTVPSMGPIFSKGSKLWALVWKVIHRSMITGLSSSLGNLSESSLGSGQRALRSAIPRSSLLSLVWDIKAKSLHACDED